MSRHSQPSGKDQSSEHLTIHFTRHDDVNASLTLNFLDQHFMSTVKLADAKYLYKKLTASRFWEQAVDKRTLIAVNSQTIRPCPRCGGSGDLPQYRHVQKGICFLCWGSGGRWGTVDSEGAVHDFSMACKSEQLGNLYDRLQQCMVRGFKEAHEKAHHEQRRIEMEKIRDRRRRKALGK